MHKLYAYLRVPTAKYIYVSCEKILDLCKYVRNSKVLEKTT